MVGSLTDRLLTADDVAAIVGMTKDWIYAEVRAGRIPHVKLGRYYRFREESIAAWIEEIETTSNYNGGRPRRAPARLQPPGA